MPHWTSGFQTRSVVTDLFGVTTTWLDDLLLGATIGANLNQPMAGTISVHSNSPRVNDIFAPDADPLLAQSNRLVYMLFREPGGATPYVCRAAGTLMSPQDEADADVPTTHFNFFDAWQFLNGTPAYIDTSGGLPGPNGFRFYGIRGGVIVATLLSNAIISAPPTDPGAGGNGYLIDAGLSYGGTAFWGGVIQDTPIIDYVVQQGASVGQCWTELLAAGNDPSGGTGGVDIVLTPIYDPVNRPGYTHELSVYNLAGVVQPAAPMAWGRFSRTSTTADREHDGTPGAFINVANYFAGQGGPGNGPVTNAASVEKYLAYVSQQFFPNQPNALAVQAMAQQALILAKQGKRTFTLNPDPLRAAAPFAVYNIGDRIPVYAPDSLRVTAAGYQRVQGIPVVVGPDGVTRVNALLTSPDWRGDSSPFPPVVGPSITYSYDGAETVTVTIPTDILVGLASDDDIFGVTDDGTTQDDASWPDALVTSDPHGAYGPTLTLTVNPIAFEDFPLAAYFVTPRNATVFRCALLVMHGTDAAPGAMLPDLTTFARIGDIQTFTYGVAADSHSGPFDTLPLPLPLPTGGGSGPPPSGGPWNWAAADATVDPNSAALITAWLSYAIGAGTYFTAAVAVQDAPGPTAFYNIPTSEAVTPVSAPVPVGTKAGASADLSVTVRQSGTDYDFGLAVYNAGTGKIQSCFGGTIQPVGAVYEPAPNSANAACFPLREGPITLADVSGGVIAHPLVFTMPNCGPAPNRYPARPGSSGYPSNTGFPLGTWLRLNPSVDVPSLGLSAFETMVCVALQTYGMFCRDIGSTFDIIGVDPVNQGGSTSAPWAARGVVLNIDNGHGVNYAVAFSGSMPWADMQVLVAPSP